MNAHLVLVPCLGTLTVGGLTGGDTKVLGGQADRTLDLEGLGAGTVDELRAHLLEGSDLARGEGDTDLVDLLYSKAKEVISSCSGGNCIYFAIAITITITITIERRYITYRALAKVLLGLLERRHLEFVRWGDRLRLL